MKVIATDLPGVMVIEPAVFGDARGFFLESWNKARYAEAGISAAFVQDNISLSQRGVLRGLHFQNPNAQGKLVYVLQGEVFDVVVDIRLGSPTFGRWVGQILSSDNQRQIYMPPGFAHGFCVVSEQALFAYKCTDIYNPGAEGSVRWDDPAIGIQWPVSAPSLSAKDKAAPLLSEWPTARLPAYNESDHG